MNQCREKCVIVYSEDKTLKLNYIVELPSINHRGICKTMSNTTGCQSVNILDNSTVE